MTRTLFLFALAVPACAHQTPVVREQPVIKVRDFCADPVTRSLCAPVLQEAPRVDTNLTAPAPNAFFG